MLVKKTILLTTTFQARMTKIKAAKPDAVYVVDFTTNTATSYRQEGQRQSDVGLNIVLHCC